MSEEGHNALALKNLAHPVICIVGPTASGKTALSVALAQKINGEVVSADSMQVYRGMDIGTSKLPVSERSVLHHGFDLVDPGEPFSAALFQSYARRCFIDIESRGHRSVLCGGTGFYVRAAIDGYDFPQGDQLDNPVRTRCMHIAEEHGAQYLHELLREQDPESAALIPAADVKRVSRAFELLADGVSYASQKERLASIEQVVPAIFFGLAVDPDILRARIDRRVDEMIAGGLIEEVSHLLNEGFRSGITAPQAIGYKEIVAALDGEITMEMAIDRIKIATHRYAKRQRTWFRKDKRIHWLAADTFDEGHLVERVLQVMDWLPDGK